ncbi:hypothetical protein L9G74_12910 [Shewanella sp. C32]|uniref:Uncharacterized protein n=1 Tax=Shewanella electrica TaxID=515560 RepID=A0ABT2FMV2_9GAMM|nr:hypothetical protein [Shewanella electrica]MCH1925769.1 hypothetical protein [Shewanella electrica]MCS4557346.1 hypothetical protein [Shewanella electrica]
MQKKSASSAGGWGGSAVSKLLAAKDGGWGGSAVSKLLAAKDGGWRMAPQRLSTASSAC